EPTPEPTPEPVFEIPEPPVPMAPGNYLEESEDGWIEFDEDGVPLGEWKWNEEEELWEFEEIIPLAEFEPEPDFEFEEEVPLAPTEPEAPPPPPKTGDSAVPFVFGGLLLTAALAAGAALKKRKED
ncbi:MAG: LPXTG cell wall anchor domain-containing protein, partial [Oscillospiraceae bacterium]|nr:LPXTG cell wall anchor domain-containing protein [Oscillospiraceae bacterium]